VHLVRGQVKGGAETAVRLEGGASRVRCVEGAVFGEKYNSTRRKGPKDYLLPLVTTGLLEIRASSFSKRSFHHILQSNIFCITPPTFSGFFTSSLSETAHKILETTFNDQKTFFSDSE
jgi:hypothetical protein